MSKKCQKNRITKSNSRLTFLNFAVANLKPFFETAKFLDENSRFFDCKTQNDPAEANFGKQKCQYKVDFRFCRYINWFSAYYIILHYPKSVAFQNAPPCTGHIIKKNFSNFLFYIGFQCFMRFVKKSNRLFWWIYEQLHPEIRDFITHRLKSKHPKRTKTGDSVSQHHPTEAKTGCRICKFTPANKGL